VTRRNTEKSPLLRAFFGGKDRRGGIKCGVPRIHQNRINLAELENKAKNLVSEYQEYTIEFRALGVEDASQWIRRWSVPPAPE
jgi:hypothetical protein